MSERQEFIPAYVIHTRPYRDTSVLVDFFTETPGRLTAVARGVRQAKSRTRGLLNPFSRVLISLQGKGELKLLTTVESDSCFFSLQGAHLYSGFYINELLMRLLPEMDEYLGLYAAYEKTLTGLHQGQELEPLLRSFELELLAEIGYGLDCEGTVDSGEAIDPESFYLCSQGGFVRAQPWSRGEILPGWVIRAVARRDFSDPGVRGFAKHLCRSLLKPLLGSRPLHSRSLFPSASR